MGAKQSGQVKSDASRLHWQPQLPCMGSLARQSASLFGSAVASPLRCMIHAPECGDHAISPHGLSLLVLVAMRVFAHLGLCCCLCPELCLLSLELRLLGDLLLPGEVNNLQAQQG